MRLKALATALCLGTSGAVAGLAGPRSEPAFALSPETEHRAPGAIVEESSRIDPNLPAMPAAVVAPELASEADEQQVKRTPLSSPDSKGFAMPVAGMRAMEAAAAYFSQKEQASEQAPALGNQSQPSPVPATPSTPSGTLAEKISAAASLVQNAPGPGQSLVDVLVNEALNKMVVGSATAAPAQPSDAVPTWSKATLPPGPYNCTSEYFDSLLPPGSKTISVNQVEEGGQFGDPYDIAYANNATNLPALCAVRINATTSVSIYNIGMMLPENWNGRFLAVGNGGYSGGVNWLDMGGGAQYGFAVMSSDLGHNGTATDQGFLEGHPEQFRDWTYRALHWATVLAKDIVNNTYGVAANYSYFSSCSCGGRQGLVEVQMFPEDYDGVIAGSPPWMYEKQSAWDLNTRTKNMPENATYFIPVSMFPTIHDEITRQCDATDGLVDGIISAPALCEFEPEALLCKDTANADNSTTCLSSGQVNTLREILTDYNERGGIIYPSLELGSEVQWSDMYSPRPPGTIAYEISVPPKRNIYEIMAYEVLVAVEKWQVQYKVDADDYDISPFAKRGGKLFHFHGWADQLIPPRGSIQYHDMVQQTMAAKGINTDDFYRLFMVPGMLHCVTSPAGAPWFFAGGNQRWPLGQGAFSVPGFEDPQHDVMMAMVEWVEQGKPIDSIIATEFENYQNYAPYRQRPLCPYPQRAIYMGGDEKNATSWQCQVETPAQYNPHNKRWY